jgi:hypothetical protein
MTDEKQDQPANEPTQETEPKKGEPIEIPVPSREDFFANLEQVSRPTDESNGEQASKPED